MHLKHLAAISPAERPPSKAPALPRDILGRDVLSLNCINKCVLFPKLTTPLTSHGAMAHLHGHPKWKVQSSLRPSAHSSRFSRSTRSERFYLCIFLAMTTIEAFISYWNKFSILFIVSKYVLHFCFGLYTAGVGAWDVGGEGEIEL